MKHFIIILTGFLFATHSIYMGAEEPHKFTPRPSHPLDPIQGRPRIMADEIRSRYYIEGLDYPAMFSHSTIKYSNDGLSDTVYIESGVIPPPIVNLYSKENRLIMIKYDYNMNGDFDDDDIKEVYTYNASGWLVSKTFYNNQNSGKPLLYDYRNIIHTDSGYILKNIEYILDEQGRLTRMGDVRYSYFEGGYIQYDTNTNRPHKSETYYYEEDYHIKTLDYTLINGKWVLNSRSETTYIFNDPSSNEDPLLQSQPVYGTNGAIIITTDATEPGYIYNISGQLVKPVHAQPNERIPMSKGLYIIRFNGDSYKVIVR